VVFEKVVPFGHGGGGCLFAGSKTRPIRGRFPKKWVALKTWGTSAPDWQDWQLARLDPQHLVQQVPKSLFLRSHSTTQPKRESGRQGSSLLDCIIATRNITFTAEAEMPSHDQPGRRRIDLLLRTMVRAKGRTKSCEVEVPCGLIARLWSPWPGQPPGAPCSEQVSESVGQHFGKSGPGQGANLCTTSC